jgi:predicted nucleic acid-binding protein
VKSFVYDAAVLVAADRRERRAWAEHKARLEMGFLPIVPAPVVAQVSRSSKQAQLRRFLAGCLVEPAGESDAHEAGRLLGLTRTTDVTDAMVVVVAARNQAVILTGDQDDIARLAQVCGREVAVVGA